MKYSYVVIILNMLYSFGSLAQEKEASFTIDEAQEYALEHNKNLINANKDLLIADEQIKEARGAGLPQVNGTVDYLTNFNYEFTFGGSGGSAQPPEIDYSLLDEGDYEVLNSLNQMMGASGPSSIVMEDQANANIQLTQLIFSGQYWLGVQMTKTGKRIAEKNIELTTLDVRENVINSYYLILVTEEMLGIIEENKKNMEEIHRHTADMYKVGIMEQTDVDQLKINLSQLENSKKAMERNLQLNYNMFRLAMGMPSGEEVVLSDDLISFIENIEAQSWLISEFNPHKNPNYQIMQTQEEISQRNVDMQKWAYAPTLSGYYNYREKLLTAGFDLAPKNSAGLTLSVPIFSGGTRKAQLNQAKIELDKINRSKELLEEQLALQNDQLTFELRSAYDNYITQRENVKVAKRVYESINNKYKQGMFSSLDLTQANTNYLQAENNYVSAIMDLLQAKLKLDKLHNNF